MSRLLKFLLVLALLLIMPVLAVVAWISVRVSFSTRAEEAATEAATIAYEPAQVKDHSVAFVENHSPAMAQHKTIEIVPGRESAADLIKAAQFGDLGAIERVIGAGVPAKGVDGQGRTALHWAAEAGQMFVLPYLVTHGADVNLQDKAGQTALHLAAARGHNGSADFLRQLGARPDIRDKDGRTPLELAERGGHTNTREAILHPGTYRIEDGPQAEARAAERQRLSHTVYVSRTNVMTWFLGLKRLLFLTLGFMILLPMVFLILAILRRRPRRSREVAIPSETEMLQQILEGLDKMERRTENLEEILLRESERPGVEK